MHRPPHSLPSPWLTLFSRQESPLLFISTSAPDPVNVAHINVCGMKSSVVFAANEPLFLSALIHRYLECPHRRSWLGLGSEFHHKQPTKSWVHFLFFIWMATAAEEPPGLQGPSGCKYCVIIPHHIFLEGINHMCLTLRWYRYIGSGYGSCGQTCLSKPSAHQAQSLSLFT